MDFLFVIVFALAILWLEIERKQTKKGQRSLIVIWFLKGRDQLIQLKCLQLDQPITSELKWQVQTAEPYREAVHRL